MTTAHAYASPIVDSAASPPTLARLVAAGKVYGTGDNAVTALAQASLEVRAGEIVGVAALEAQGQDQLFEALAGMSRAKGGSIERNGQAVRFRDPYDAIRRGIVLVPADRVMALLPDRPIRENIAAPLYAPMKRWGVFNSRAEKGRVDDAIARLQVDTRASRAARRLSGGNQQKLTIARWVAAGFEVLLCFDPTRGIDVGTKAEIYRLIERLAAEGIAVLMISSDLPEVLRMSDRILVMREGRLAGEFPRAAASQEAIAGAMMGGEREPAAAVAGAA